MNTLIWGGVGITFVFFLLLVPLVLVEYGLCTWVDFSLALVDKILLFLYQKKVTFDAI